jgi:hypothetical protein
MRFAVQENLTEGGIQSGLNNMIKNGITSQTMAILLG